MICALTIHLNCDDEKRFRDFFSSLLGGTGAFLFVALLIGLYFYGTSVATDEPTLETLQGTWETRIIERHGRLAVRLYARFDQPSNAVWQFVRNYEEYPERLDYVVSAEVIDRNETGSTLKLVTRSFPSNLSETLKMEYEDKQSGRIARWTQIEGTLAHNDGDWEVLQSGEGTFLRYTMCVSYGSVVPDWLLNSLLRLYVSDVVRSIRRVVSGDKT